VRKIWRRYNVIENGWSHQAGFLWGVIFPWVAALPLLYQPGALNQFISFSSLLFVSFTDFIVPWCLYITLQRDALKSGTATDRGGDIQRGLIRAQQYAWGPRWPVPQGGGGGGGL
jgi:hypothetical protein